MTLSLDSNPRSAPRVHEVVLLVADTLDLVLRRGADGNALDALDLVQHQVAAWGERRAELVEVAENLLVIHAALADTPRGAPPGSFTERFDEGAM